MTTSSPKTVKSANYSPADVAQVLANYSENQNIAEWAEAVGRTVASIRAKLSREGVYVAKTAEKKEGATASLDKTEIVQVIAAFLGLPKDSLATLTKATKADLKELEEAIIKAAHVADNKPYPRDNY